MGTKPIGALIVSADEPQLKRCLAAVKNQTVPFSSVVHINNVIPESKAFNQGMSMVTDEWVMKVDGDFILYDNAVEMVMASMDDDAENVQMYSYPVYDSFLRKHIFGCGVFYTPIYKQHRYPNMLSNDLYVGKKLRRLGYRTVRPFGGDVTIATHCEDPDEFQVFRRFFTRGVKSGRGYIWTHLCEMLNKTGDPLYQLAMDAVDFGIMMKRYPTSHNLDYDKRVYKEFKKQCIAQNISAKR